MYCAPGFIFGCTEGFGSRFHVLLSRTCFWRCGWGRVLFSCLALPDTFSAVPRASGPVLHSGLIFGGTEGVGSSFHVFSFSDSFSTVGRMSGPFSCFACLDSFSAVPRSSGPIFMFCHHGHIFDGTEGVGSRFHVLHPWTHFRRYREHRVPFSCFERPNSLLTVRASVPVFMFCVPGLIFGGAEVIGSHFHVLPSRAHFRRYRGRQVPFSSFALPDSISAVPSASGLVFMFCAPGLFFDGT
jgi:hypothetical protein